MLRGSGVRAQQRGATRGQSGLAAAQGTGGRRRAAQRRNERVRRFRAPVDDVPIVQILLVPVVRALVVNSGGVTMLCGGGGMLARVLNYIDPFLQ